MKASGLTTFALLCGAQLAAAEHARGYFVYLRDDLPLPQEIVAMGNKVNLRRGAGAGMTRAERRQAVYDHRTAMAAYTQPAITSVLREAGLQSVQSIAAVSPDSRRAAMRSKKEGRSFFNGYFESLWITNALYVLPESAMNTGEFDTESTVKEDPFITQLRAHPFVASVERDQKKFTVEQLEFKEVNRAQAADNDDLEWNIKKILADQLWDKNVNGTGITVCNIDTGVRHTHEALRGNYRGVLQSTDPENPIHDYNWFDPKEFRNDEWWCDPDWPLPPECVAEYPFDNNGHGSHCMGTSVGSADFGIGVAPGASWIAAKGCRDGGCFDYGLTVSMQWALCPTDLNGENPRCDLGADVVSNSWGGPSGDPFRMDTVMAWREAGIIPVFSGGNSGSECQTSGSPGDFDMVIGVGATDIEDSLTAFSSRGPSRRGSEEGFAIQKPDISAPGRAILSAHSSMGMRDDARYSLSSGTSMAAPHVAGAVALLLSAQPDLSYDQVYRALTSSANKRVPAPETGGPDECLGLRWDQFPNLHYGHGRLDTLRAVEGSDARKF